MFTLIALGFVCAFWIVYTYRLCLRSGRYSKWLSLLIALLLALSLVGILGSWSLSVGGKPSMLNFIYKHYVLELIVFLVCGFIFQIILLFAMIYRHSSEQDSRG